MQNSRTVAYFPLLDFGGDLVVVLVIVVQAVAVKGLKESQLPVLDLRLEFDNIIVKYFSKGQDCKIFIT